MADPPDPHSDWPCGNVCHHLKGTIIVSHSLEQPPTTEPLSNRMPRRPAKRKEDIEEVDEEGPSGGRAATSPADVSNCTESYSHSEPSLSPSTSQVIQHLSSTSDVSSLILSSSTLIPIQPVSEHPLLPTSVAQIPPLDRCFQRPAREKGVFGWGPPCGPEWCKFVIFLRHTSPLAVTFLSACQCPYSGSRFFIDFGPTRVPAVPHKFFFKQSEYAFDTVNVEGLGRDREILVSLVPRQEERGKSRVPIWLNVIGECGRILNCLQLGHFEYDQKVPLKTYFEQSRNRGWNFLEFLTQQRPTLEEAKFPGRYLASELMAPSESDSPLTSDSSGMDTISSISTPSQKRRPTSHVLDPSERPSTPKSQPRKRRSKSTSVIRTSLTPTSPTGQVQQKYVTLKFTDPSPSVLGIPSLAQWSPYELQKRRRLVTFTCKTDQPRLIAEFTAAPVPTPGHAPGGSIVVSCIYVQDHTSQLQNSCIITSYDFINLVKWMLGSPAWYEVDERNRVRRNLEVFSPVTLQKAGSYDYLDLFRQVTSYENPRPWNIQKDFKVFDWALVETMMREIVKKYSVAVPEGDGVVGYLADVVGEDDDIEGEFLEAQRVLMEDLMAQGGNLDGTEIAGLQSLPRPIHSACQIDHDRTRFDPGFQFAIPMETSGPVPREKSPDTSFNTGQGATLAHPSFASTQFRSQDSFQSQPTLFTHAEALESLLDKSSPFRQVGMTGYNISSVQGPLDPDVSSQDTLSNLRHLTEAHQLQSGDSGTVRPENPTTTNEIVHCEPSWFGFDAQQPDDPSFWLNTPFTAAPT